MMAGLGASTVSAVCRCRGWDGRDGISAHSVPIDDGDGGAGIGDMHYVAVDVYRTVHIWWFNFFQRQ